MIHTIENKQMNNIAFFYSSQSDTGVSISAIKFDSSSCIDSDGAIMPGVWYEMLEFYKGPESFTVATGNFGFKILDQLIDHIADDCSENFYNNNEKQTARDSKGE